MPRQLARAATTGGQAEAIVVDFGEVETGFFREAGGSIASQSQHMSPSNGIHKRWTSQVAFYRLPERLTRIVARLESNRVGAGQQVAEVFVRLAVGTLLGVIWSRRH